ncbi:MAG TPA: cation diffusion facilitator family transporter [Azospira sp.]|nr:cation diffusion facilitator family transporter [Azospira sp.]
MGHGHHHHDCAHGHAHHRGNRGLLLATLLTLGFAGVEALAGAWSGSLALLSDAGHMVNDGVALALAALAAWIARRPPSHRHTYGWGRAEVLAALINGLAMLALVVAILVEAVERFQNPAPVAGPMVMAVAVVGLLVNALVAWMLSRDESSLNTRAALLHVLGDLLGSVAAIASGAIVYFTGWRQADPLLAAGIALLISVSSLRLLREALAPLMEAAPPHISALEVSTAMEQVGGVSGVYDLHVWTVGDGEVMLSAHLQVADLNAWPATLAELRRVLKQRWGIAHVTLQPETGPIEPLHRIS